MIVKKGLNSKTQNSVGLLVVEVADHFLGRVECCVFGAGSGQLVLVARNQAQKSYLVLSKGKSERL